jgi:hypothetical protein
MLQDPRSPGAGGRIRGQLADFVISTDRHRGPRSLSFSDELRRRCSRSRFASSDVFRHNRSILDFLYARDTFVNPILARHYGMPPGGAMKAFGSRPRRRPLRRAASAHGRVFDKERAGPADQPVKRGYWRKHTAIKPAAAPGGSRVAR